MSDMGLLTILEVAVNAADGTLARMGMVRSSGVTQFDVGAIEAVMRGAPYGKAPEAIVSGDRLVHVQWEFHRNPLVSCSTSNARPFLRP